MRGENSRPNGGCQEHAPILSTHEYCEQEGVNPFPPQKLVTATDLQKSFKKKERTHMSPKLKTYFESTKRTTRPIIQGPPMWVLAGEFGVHGCLLAHCGCWRVCATRCLYVSKNTLTSWGLVQGRGGYMRCHHMHDNGRYGYPPSRSRMGAVGETERTKRLVRFSYFFPFLLSFRDGERLLFVYGSLQNSKDAHNRNHHARHAERFASSPPLEHAADANVEHV